MKRYLLTTAFIIILCCSGCNKEKKIHEENLKAINSNENVVAYSDSVKETNIKSDVTTDSVRATNLVNLFGVEVERDSKAVIDSLMSKRIIEVDSIRIDEHGEVHCVAKFGGVRFGLNTSKTGLIFITSRNSDRDYKNIKKRIERYYGKNRDNEWHGCYWKTSLWNGIDIRIRPLHTEDGGLVMFWDYPINLTKQ